MRELLDLSAFLLKLAILIPFTRVIYGIWWVTGSWRLEGWLYAKPGLYWRYM